MQGRWLLFSTIILAGCLASNALQYEAVAEQNVYRIAKTRKGMSEREVLKIMHKPYSYETFQIEDDLYDVWFYVTRTTGLDQTRMVPQNLTPLTFKNGVLVGTGYAWYYYALKEQAAAEKALNPPPPKPPTQEEEDREFEKILRPEKKPVPMKKTSALLSYNDVPVGARLDFWSPVPMAAIQKDMLSQAKIGMSETEVTNLIGSPASYESFTLNDDVYDVWFYEVMDRSGNITYLPLTFKNSVLAAKSQRYYNKIRAKATPRREYDQRSKQMLETEGEQNFDYW